MAGHSHAKNVMHRKGRANAAKSALFTRLMKEIQVAAKSGLPDPAANPRLRMAVQAARQANVPKDNIERAIKRSQGSDAENYEEVRYEGYGPGGVAIIVEALTDNRNRTAADVRSALTKLGGSMAEPGAVSWQFKRQGIIILDKVADGDELMLAALDAGADDVADEGEGTWKVTCAPSVTYELKEALEQAGYQVVSADSPMVSENLVPVTNVEDAKKILRIIETIEDNDDVQDVYSNFDIADDVMEAAAAG